jgi:hypothetical protein
MTTTEHAKQIRETLKKRNGWTGRQVSVRAEYFSMGSSITVTIKDPTVPLGPVKEIAETAERISRCEITGEILSGGNRYVSVSYDHEALKVRSAAYLPAVEAALAKVQESSLIDVEGTSYMVGRDHFGRPTLWSDSLIHTGYDAESIAQQIACLRNQ